MQLNRQIVRLAADASVFDAPQDARRSALPAFWRGSDVVFQIALFDTGTLLDVANVASLTVELRPAGPDRGPPTGPVAPVMARTVSTFTLSLTEAAWAAGTSAHVEVMFSQGETAVTPGDYWLSVWVTLTGSPGTRVNFLAGCLEVWDDGVGGPGSPPPPVAAYYAQEVADARFVQKAQNLGDIADRALARANLDVFSTGDAIHRLAQRGGGRRYFGGFTRLPAQANLHNLFTFGGEVHFLVCPQSATPAAVLLDAGAYRVEVEPGTATHAQVAFTGALTGTNLKVRTGAVLPLNRFTWLRITWDGRAGSGAQIWLNDIRQTLTVVTTGVGSAAADTATKTLGADQTGLLPFQGILARYVPLNYQLTDAQWLECLATGIPPSGNRPGSGASAFTNGGCESGPPDGFVLHSGASLSTVAPRSGAQHVLLAGNQFLYRSVLAEIGRWYRVVLHARKGTGSGGGYLMVGGANATVLYPTKVDGGPLAPVASVTHTDYRLYDTGPFVATSGTRVDIWNGQSWSGYTAGAELYLDDLGFYTLGPLWRGDLGGGVGRVVPDSAWGNDGIDSPTGVEPWPEVPLAASPLTARHVDCQSDRILVDTSGPLLPAQVALGEAVEIRNHTASAVTGLKLQASDLTNHTDLTAPSGAIPAGGATRLPLVQPVPADRRYLRVPGVPGATDISFVVWQRRQPLI